MITVRATYRTHRVREWRRLALDLGLVVSSSDASRDEFDGGGVLSVAAADDVHALPGTTSLHLLVDDLPLRAEALSAAGMDVETRAMPDGHDELVVRGRNGVRVSVSQGARQTEGPLTVMPIWSQEDGGELVRLLGALGLAERLRSDSGTWIDFEADGGGLVAFHTGMGFEMTLSFEYSGDLDKLAARMRDRGWDASVIDEAYNRTLLLPTPDGWTLWINGVIADLYGYRRAEHP